MTQERNPTSSPQQGTPDQEYLPPGQHVPAPSTPGDDRTPPHGFAPPGPPPSSGPPASSGPPPPSGPPPSSTPSPWVGPGQPVAGQPVYGLPTPTPTARGRRPLWIAVGVLVAVVVVLAGVLTWTLVAAGPDPAPPAAAPPAAAPAAESPALATAARLQFGAAFTRFSQAGVRFGQQAQQAGTTNDRELARSAVADFRAATYGYDAEIRRITFPNAQQTVVNTQLLPATGRLVGDLDQLGNLDPASMRSAGDRMVGDDRTTVQLSRQVLNDLGGI